MNNKSEKERRACSWWPWLSRRRHDRIIQEWQIQYERLCVKIEGLRYRNEKLSSEATAMARKLTAGMRREGGAPRVDFYCGKKVGEAFASDAAVDEVGQEFARMVTWDVCDGLKDYAVLAVTPLGQRVIASIDAVLKETEVNNERREREEKAAGVDRRGVGGGGAVAQESEAAGDRPGQSAQGATGGPA